MNVTWTEEKRKHYSDAAKLRWADPFYRANHGKSIQKPPCCPGCGEVNIVNFYVDKNNRRTNKHCKECHKKQCNIRWHKTPELDRQASRVRKYGIEPEQYKQMHVEQDGKCAICGVEPKTKRGLHIDHCHDTGVIRGLLCSGCNTGIGLLQEDPEIMTKAIEYLLRSK